MRVALNHLRPLDHLSFLGWSDGSFEEQDRPVPGKRIRGRGFKPTFELEATGARSKQVTLSMSLEQVKAYEENGKEARGMCLLEPLSLQQVCFQNEMKSVPACLWTAEGQCWILFQKRWGIVRRMHCGLSKFWAGPQQLKVWRSSANLPLTWEPCRGQGFQIQNLRLQKDLYLLCFRFRSLSFGSRKSQDQHPVGNQQLTDENVSKLRALTYFLQNYWDIFGCFKITFNIRQVAAR